MSLEKISVTLYDLLGYVLPGFLVLLGVSVFEATFLGSNVLYLARLVKNPIVVVIVAYFIGQITHALASWLKERFRKRFTDENYRLSARLYHRVKEQLREFYDLAEDGDAAEGLNTLETYQLSEAYMAVSGGHLDRDVYLAREGFAKSTMVASAFLAFTLLVCIFHGGAVVQMLASSQIRVTWYGTFIAALLAFAAMLVFRRQFLFFSRLKNNYTMLAFLAHRQKDVKAAEAAARAAAQSQAAALPTSADGAASATSDAGGRRNTRRH